MRESYESLLIRQWKDRPEMRIDDFVKLIYTGEYGGGHLIYDARASYARLTTEYASMPTKPDDEPLFEPIADDIARLNLRPLRGGSISLSLVNRMFVHTARVKKGERVGMEDKLQTLERLIAEGVFPLDIEESRAFLAQYRQDGYPSLSHSEAYRACYAPAYRVVLRSFMDFHELYGRIDALLCQNRQVIVAIDGNSGAGKSTLATQLQSVFDANVFHMDDFFLPPRRKTPERLMEPGGNVDYERFYDEIALNLREPSLRYRAYDCSTGMLSNAYLVQARPVTIVEGVYSLHPKMADQYDLKVFLQTDKRTQSERILSRSGPELHKRFVDEWIPLEDKYFDAFDIPANSDLVLQGK